MNRIRIVALAVILLPATVTSQSADALLPPSPYTHLLGAMHTHTGYSDGVPGSTPDHAYGRARDLEGLDFMAVSDHSEAFDAPSTFSEQCLPHAGGTLVECALADPDPLAAAGKWDTQRIIAANASRPRDFLALRAFEWSSDVYGHMNVYFSRNYTSWLRDGGAATLDGFYEWLRTPTLLGGGADGLATFNHSDDKTTCKTLPSQARGPLAPVCALDPTRNWNDFAYRADLDDRIVAIEAYNRSRSYEPFVVRALDKGWHLGVVGAEDIHESDWGAPRYAKTVVLATDRTPAAFKEALAARRTYATMDQAIRIRFETDAGEPMGSRIARPHANLVAEVAGGDVARIDILSNGFGTPNGDAATIVASVQGRSLSVPVVAPDGERWFLLRVTDSAGRRTAYSSPIWVGSAPAAPFTPRWVAGDLHVHTTWSHDSYGGPHDDSTGHDEAYTLGWTPGEQIGIAESRGLDFLAITDHNDTRAAYDPGLSSATVALIPSYENSLKGHAQMLNTSECVTPSGPDGRTTGCNGFANRDQRSSIAALADALRAHGGAFQVNHPSDGNWIRGFGDGSAADAIVPDSVEVWNVGPWVWQPPAPSSNDNDAALAFWQTYLNAGHRVAATGGSDNHWRSTTAAQGVGQPTTWVYVTEPGPDGIVAGLRAGRTTIAAQPPGLGGVRLTLEADTDGDGDTDAAIGDVVAGIATLRLRSDGAPPGSMYRVITDAGVVEVASDGAVTDVAVANGVRWVRAELFVPDAQAERTARCDPLVASRTTMCRNRLVMAALTSPIYVA